MILTNQENEGKKDKIVQCYTIREEKKMGREAGREEEGENETQKI